ncbi:MAG: hypothetical protein RLZZ224_637 [Verrucomicrobiota bacterium]|jgi:hypothetical protein
MVGTQAAIEAGFDRISEFSEFCHENHPEIQQSDTALFRIPKDGAHLLL